jgi:glutamate carboxypeptidase
MDFNQYFKSRQGEMIALLKQLVGLESPTADKNAVDACSAFLVAKFQALGVKLVRYPQKKIGDFHLLEYPAREVKSQSERLLILTHIDTVWPVGRIAKMPFYIQGEKIFGPGVLDMKAGLVLAYSAIRALREMNMMPAKRIAVFINSSEECGCPEADQAIKEQARAAAQVLCLEPALPGGALKVQRKGRLVLRLETAGRSAHAGQPEKGLNAIDELIAQLKKLAVLRSRDVTLNIGQIGGGEKANVVADRAWAVLDWRFWTADQRDRILASAKSLKPAARGARIKCSTESQTPPMEKTSASTRLFEAARTIAAELGQKLSGGKTGGGSDASLAAGLGRPTLDGLGPDGDGIHADNEHILLPSLVERAVLLTELCRRL